MNADGVRKAYDAGWRNFSGEDLCRVDLTGIDLRGANLSRADLSSANLAGADLRGANLWGAWLYGTDLRRADLCGTNLRGAKLEGACLDGAKWDEYTIWPEGFPPPAAEKATEQTMAEWVEDRIHALFLDAAEMFGSGEVWPEATEEQAAGVPGELVRATMYMCNAWRVWLASGSEEVAGDQEQA